jgi:hypothetical protein
LQFKTARKAAAGSCSCGSDGLSLHLLDWPKLVDPVPADPAIEVNRVKPDLSRDSVVGDRKVFCHLLQQAWSKPELLTRRHGIDENDQRVAVVSSSDSRPVVDPPKL